MLVGFRYIRTLTRRMAVVYVIGTHSHKWPRGQCGPLEVTWTGGSTEGSIRLGRVKGCVGRGNVDSAIQTMLVIEDLENQRAG